jgi:murein DD-endopeptidase MepM/ murein hydrolase activator NlpD
MVLIFSVLLAANAGIAHILINQIAITAGAQSLSEVKNDQVTATDAGKISQQNAIEPIVDEKPAITVYTVKAGDTISTIAEEFNISVSTIRWANDLNAKAVINVGDKLTILPVTGIQYKVKSGDTISGIAKKFDADQMEIITFNDLENGQAIKAGMELIIPDGEPVQAPKAAPKPAKKSTPSKSATVDHDEKVSKAVSSGYYIIPIVDGIITQGVHGYNGIDIGAPIGTSVLAAADGEVILVKGGNAWNGGYGNYIVIKHSNGTQTLYAHLSKNLVSIGDNVSQGEKIGLSGNTGKSTGPHLHYEVRGSTNNMKKFKIGTNI